MKKVGIVGANSYIARNLVNVLKAQYKECAFRLYDYKDYHVDKEEGYKKINVLDKNSTKGIDMSCDVIFMFVGKTGSTNGFDDYDTFIDVNERALLNLLNEYRIQNSSAKIIFPSTRLVYKGLKSPQKEESAKEFKTIYAINKFACEQYLRQFNNVFGVRYCIFRICIPYGTLVPGAMSYGTTEFMINKAANRKNIVIYGDGSGRRTLTHVEDLCRIMTEAAFNDKCIDDVYNIGGEDYSLKEMAELIAEKYDVGIDYIQYPIITEKIESGDTVFDDSKIKSICSIEYKYSFRDWCNES